MSLSLFYNNVTVLDYAYLDLNRGVVGDSLAVNVEFIGTVDDEGVIFDFSLAKKKVKNIIDDLCDHRLLVPQQAEKLALDKNNQSIKLKFQQLEYHCPDQAICLIDISEINLTSIAQHIECILKPKMPKEVSAVRITLDREVSNDTADLFFHYTHGLKQHYGNCQRLLHGHRSSLQVLSAGIRQQDLEQWLIQDIFDTSIHFVFAENIKNTNELHLLDNGQIALRQTVKIGYISEQGEFYLELPSRMVHIVPIETTVENLSTYFLDICKKKKALKHLEVRAYEGIGKGAKSSF